MPPSRPKPLPKRELPLGSAAVQTEIRLGNLRVGYHGTTLEEAVDDTPTQRLDISLDDLSIVKRDLGRGASGSVALYKHRSTNTYYAVKKINLSGAKETKEGIAEIQRVFATNCENLVRLYNAFLRDNALFFVMEYMDGGSLEDLLDRARSVSEPVAAHVAHQVLKALSNMHTKQHLLADNGPKSMRQVHRDIKPSNVMLGRDGAVKLADFGVAGNAASIGLVSFVGTPTYMSPERIRGQPHNTAADIWSVGILVAHMLLGKYPFEESSQNFLHLLQRITAVESLKIPAISDDCQCFLDACIRQNPNDRSTASDLLTHRWITQHTLPGADGSPPRGLSEFLETLLLSVPTRDA